MRMRAALIAFAALCSGCGGSGSGSSSPTESVDGSGEWCDLPYYRNIIGSYIGNIKYQRLDAQTGAERQNCQWDTRLTITGESILNKCFMQMQLNAEPTQLFVPDSSDPGVYQCRADDNRIYRIIDPNQNANDEAILSQIGFPVVLRESGHDLDPSTGSYFGDTSISAAQVYLFSSAASIFDRILISNEDYLTLEGPTSSTFVTISVESELSKEIP